MRDDVDNHRNPLILDDVPFGGGRCDDGVAPGSGGGSDPIEIRRVCLFGDLSARSPGPRGWVRLEADVT